jgi:hypothetical protein
MAVNNLNTPGVGIQPSIVDAKGDLIAGTAADAVGRLAVGTNGQQLVADSTASTGLKWDNPSGLVHIETQTFSAVSAVNFNSVFSSTYDNYRIVATINSSNNAAVSIRLRLATTDNTTSNYQFQRLEVSGTSVSGARSTNQTSSVIASPGAGNNFFVSDVANPFLTTPTLFATKTNAVGNTTGIYFYDTVSGHNVSSSFDGITFITDAAQSGAISIYGYRK